MFKRRIGEQIRMHRKAKKMTLQQLEKLTGINNGNLSKIERGSQGLTEEAMLKIASALGMNLAELVEARTDKMDEIKQLAGGAPGAMPHATFISYRGLKDLPSGVNILIDRIEAAPVSGTRPPWRPNPQEPLMFNSDSLKTLSSVPGNLLSLYVSDDSMAPRLFKGDQVLVDISEVIVPDTGGVFAAMYEQDLIVRRVFRKPGGGLIMMTDNTQFPNLDVPRSDMDHIEIIGRLKYRSGAGDF